ARGFDPDASYRFLFYIHLHSIFLSFNHPSPSKLYTLSLHDALPISITIGFYLSGNVLSDPHLAQALAFGMFVVLAVMMLIYVPLDRKSTRLNSSHVAISYAVFCLKKKIRMFTRSTAHSPMSKSPCYH